MAWTASSWQGGWWEVGLLLRTHSGAGPSQVTLHLCLQLRVTYSLGPALGAGLSEVGLKVPCWLLQWTSRHRHRACVALLPRQERAPPCKAT